MFDVRFQLTNSFLAIILLFSASAGAASIPCGTVVISDTVLQENLDCRSAPSDAIYVGASGITIDLNGYSILGGTDYSALSSDGFSNITVRNGAISGFWYGVLFVNGSRLDLHQLTISGQSDHSILVGDSNGVSVKDVSVTLPVSALGSGITLVRVDDAKVKHANLNGGEYGVLSISETKTVKGVKVEDSVITNCRGVGVRMLNNRKAVIRRNHITGAPGQCFSGVDLVDLPSFDVLIQENRITSCGIGIFIGADSSTGIRIVDNRVYENGDGIVTWGVHGSEIVGNHAYLNEYAGIGLVHGSTGNDVMFNVATGNRQSDMLHDVDSSPNSWFGNQCVTSDEGIEVDCP